MFQIGHRPRSANYTYSSLCSLLSPMEYPKNETQEANVGFLICQLDRKKPAAPSGDDPHIMPSPLKMDSDSFNSVDTWMKILFDSEEAGV